MPREKARPSLRKIPPAGFVQNLAPVQLQGRGGRSFGATWTVRPWDFVFIRHNTLQEAPSPLCGYHAENRHVAEIYDIKSRHEFVADAPRPWFKKWRRLPEPD